MTYGDGVADIDVAALIAFHRAWEACHGHRRDAARPLRRAGAHGDRVTRFSEKPPGDNALINGGFFVLHPGVLDRIAARHAVGDRSRWRASPATASCAPTVTPASGSRWTRCATGRLETLWLSGAAPWKVWKD